MARFIRFFDTLRHLPKPTVAGLNGHTYAGGSILALACDERIMAEGDFQFALNEVTLGVVLPARMVQALAAVVPGPTARQMFLEGHAWRAQDAQLHGIVDELVPLSSVRHRALTLARQLASKPPRAFAAHKRALVETGGDPPTRPRNRGDGRGVRRRLVRRGVPVLSRPAGVAAADQMRLSRQVAAVVVRPAGAAGRYRGTRRR